MENAATNQQRLKSAFSSLLTGTRRYFSKAVAAAAALEMLCCASAGSAWAQQDPTQQQGQSSYGQGGAGAPQATPSSSANQPAYPQGAGPTPPGYSDRSLPTVTEEPTTNAPAPSAPKTPKSVLDTRVTVRVKAAPLGAFLDAIAAQAKVNFIVAEGVQDKKVTAFLQNVTVREALQVLLEMKGLTYERIGKSSTYLVLARSVKARNWIVKIYTLNWIPLIPLQSLQSAQQSITPMTGGSAMGGGGGGMGMGMGGGGMGGMGGGGMGGMGGGGMGGMGGGGMGGMGGGGMGGSGGNNSGVVIMNILKTIIGNSGAVAVDPRTNSLIVTGTPEIFPQVEDIIDALDKKVPQVLIEAQVVEIDANKANDLGLEWGGPNGGLATFTGGERDTTFPMILPSNLSNLALFNPNPSVISQLAMMGGQMMNQSQNVGLGGSNSSVTSGSLNLNQTGVLTSVLNLQQLTVVLRALVSRTEARFLGKPKVLTLNNQPAVVQIAAKTAVDVMQAVTSGFGSGTSQAGATVDRTTTGVILSVTPQVNKDGYVTMYVQPQFVNTQTSPLSSSAQPIQDPLSRSVSTVVRIKNGQTLVLGGLLESNKNKVVRKVPLLGYIPIIGWFFTSTQASTTNTDLVVFITPTIMLD